MQADEFVERQNELTEKMIAGDIDAAVHRSACSTWQWLASKRAPKRYGDRLELAGDPEAPLQARVVVEHVNPPGVDKIDPKRFHGKG